MKYDSAHVFGSEWFAKSEMRRETSLFAHDSLGGVCIRTRAIPISASSVEGLESYSIQWCALGSGSERVRAQRLPSTIALGSEAEKRMEIFIGLV